MHDLYVLTKEFFCQINYGNIQKLFGGTIRTLPIYKPFATNLPYVSGVSVPAEEPQYV